jgi:eukaryotic-like serine/threonine-protein kinase
VWAARGPDGRATALKVAHGSSDSWRIRYAREADALAAIGPSHAPQLLAHGVLDDGRPWIAMERIDGTTLADHLADRPDATDVEPPRALADALLAAVDAMHGRGLVHRDLKPENVFLRRTHASAPVVALTDFGLAGAALPTAGQPAPDGFTLGTLGYMAPEVLAGSASDARADVYALGVILYELFAGRPPFVGDPPALEHAHLALRPPRPGLFAPVPRAIEELILSCLAKEPDRRPADAAALRRQVDSAGGEWLPAAPDRPPASPLAGDARELVALAWVEVDTGSARLAADIARTPGTLVRQHGRGCLVMFTAARSERPASAAVAAATRLVAAWGGRAAIHLDRVELGRRAGRPPSAYGTPIDRPADWLPAASWTGLLLTRDLVDALGDLPVIAADQPGFFALAGAVSHKPPPLVGRSDILRALEASARECFHTNRPALVTLVGGPGGGKSRLLAEVAAAAGRLGAARILVEVAANPHAFDPRDGEAFRRRARLGPLAVLVDDAHLADDAVLDALEYAALGGASVPLWILVSADGPAIDQIRPRFGQRAARCERFEIAPLPDRDMRELAASLLLPADYLPVAVLDRLAGLAGGNPGLLSELVRALKREGAVRPRSDRRSHELAVEAIERVPATAAGRWEASRALDALPPELAASARLAACLGPVVDEAELEWVEDALESGGEGSFFDAGVAMRALAGRDLVVARGPRTWAFASPLVQDAIYQALPAAERARIHKHALGYWPGKPGARALAAVARHAGLAGAHAEAAAAALELAESAAAAHRDLEADRWFSAALQHVADQATRVRALTGRGRVTWRLDRAPEALADLAAARAIAGETADSAAQAGILLDEAMVLDWCGELEASAARVEEARPLVEREGDAALSARLLVATGRTAWREERVSEALTLLSEGVAQAADPETRLIALLLSGTALSWLGRLDEAEATFGEAEKLAAARGDRLHMCSLHVNRIILWLTREDAERGANDLRRAVQLARELGHPIVERAATHNLASILHAEGRDAEALPLAIRSFELQQRFTARPGPEDALLLCRIAVGLGDRESAARHLAWVEAHAPPAEAAPTLRLFHRALVLVQQGGSAEEWNAVVSDAAGMLPVEHLEILYLRAASELGSGQIEAARATFAAARTYIDRFPVWAARFEGLAAGTPAWGSTQQPPPRAARTDGNRPMSSS